MRYHDVFSKSKFDIGRTDVIEHKVTMKSEDPFHIRQFRIPLEHRQTIYDWVDELLTNLLLPCLMILGIVVSSHSPGVR